MEKILAGAAFARSGRMSRFLRLAVEYALDGRGAELKEYPIAVEVFDRPASFDPRADPIVRVEARRLRAKLRAYYEGEGRADDVVIELPTGGYAPVFRERAAARPAPAVPAATWRNTIAVLPFANLSAGGENDYFSDGLTEELIRQLTKVAGLRVVAWTSAAQLRGREDIRGVAEQLKVAHVLQGSVRRSGGRLRAAAQLLDAAEGCYLWAETYDREMRDVFAIQDEIAWAIVKALRMRLAEPAAPVSHAAYNLEAYDLYLKGRFHWNLRTPEGLRKSIRCFEEAVARDASFAPGYAGLADAYGVLTEYGLVPSSEGMAKASAAALQALERDPYLAEAHASLGPIRSIYEWNWAEGERCYRRAIELNPGYATAHHWLAVDLLALVGRWEEAETEIEVARQLDPLSPIILEGVGFTALFARDYERALARYRELLDLHPTFYKVYTAMGRAHALMGRYDQAVMMFEKGRALGGEVPSILGALGQVYALAGRTEEARGLLAELAALEQRGYVAAAPFAVLHLGLGDHARALDWLENGCEWHDLSIATIGVHPVYDPLRGEPRFQALLRRMGLGR